MTQKKTLPAHSSYAAVWAVTRLWAVLSGLQLFPYPGSQYLFSDVQLYDWWAFNMLQGKFPVHDETWQYPALAAIVFIAGYLIHPGRIGFIVLCLIADAWVTRKLLRAGRSSTKSTELPIQMWLVMPLVMGPIAFGRFDMFPTACVIAFLLTRSDRTAGISIGVGSMLKVWPVLALLALARNRIMRTTTWVGVTVAVLSIALNSWWSGSLAFIAEQKSRGLQIESVWALPYILSNLGAGTTNLAYQYGAIEVVANGTARVCAAATATGAVLFAILVWWRVRGRLEKVDPGLIVLTCVLTAMVTSRVLSPQYDLWYLGVLAACAVRPFRGFVPIARLLFVSAFLTQFVYPWLYGPLEAGSGFATAVHTGRIVTLLWATVLCWISVAQQRTRAHPNQPASAATVRP